ncbi:5'-methylthioadenosine/S-adenosylhomocysteine nucleosidase [Bartonella sp. M0177]|uniref:5'-methylthioadenosine/S-adenosylhomocysteine nucleosidase n=1 Tax=Bartonella sp. M0177 TaxID=2750940 RepID=UPI0018DC8902|nr:MULTISPECIES: 5'-methylthioadenosine/S-adenosylhomocysteine nucleosidase [Bartonella]MBI0003011.1 5'-methylthioadenosine/S-adenosylhomocysteine nucleosidase [Bartonella sp. M0177]WLT09029.1 5'-methylthioadenosine/S-adenosylhomocysteine nucleosidase [Bartonella apihabitans]
MTRSSMWGEKSVLFLMATELEYGEHLKKLIKPHIIGVGPIEAAINTTKILSAMKNGNRLPDLVVSLGSSGSQKLKQTEVYQVSSVSWRDMDATVLGVEKGVTPFVDLPATVDMPTLIPDFPSASLSTGGNVVSGDGYKKIDTDMVDMETYAVLRSCQTFNVPLFGLRGISDGQKELEHAMDWRQYLHIVDEKLANALKLLDKVLGQREK